MPDNIPPQLVLGFRRRSLADLAGYDTHARRAHQDQPHVDPRRTHLNRCLLGGMQIGQAHATATALAGAMAAENLVAKIEGLKKRRRKNEIKALRDLASTRGPMAAAGEPWDAKNEKPFFDGILSASPSYFAASHPPVTHLHAKRGRLTLEDACQQRGWDPEKLEAWASVATEWLTATFGDDLIDVRLDLDERTPHIHFVGAPRTIDKRGRHMLSQRSHLVLGERKSDEDERESYERVRDEAAPSFAELGIERGERRAAAKRKRLAAATQVISLPLTPKEGRELGAELVGGAKLRSDTIVASAKQDATRIRKEAHAEAESEIEFARHCAEVLLGATDLVIDGQVRPEGGSGTRMQARSSAQVSEFSRRFAPTEHDDLLPAKGLFSAIRTAGLWPQIRALADRVRALLLREAAVTAREAELTHNKAKLAEAQKQVGEEKDSVNRERRAAEEIRADAEWKLAEANAVLAEAALAGDRLAARRLAAYRARSRAIGGR